jgi:hypothetical protein
VVWNIYEKYIREICETKCEDVKFKIEPVFNDLINKIEPDNAEKIKDEFNVIRNTRNSFHNGGVYNRDFDEFKGVFLNEEYEFTPGQPVKPLRIMDVVKTIWEHYKIIENLNIT